MAKPSRSICFVESVDTGRFLPALFTSKEIGPEVWRQRAFHSLNELLELDDQDLADVARELNIELTTKEETAQQIWDRAINSQSVYARTREQSKEFLQKGLDIMAKSVKKAAKRKTATRKTNTEPKEGQRGRPSELAGKKIYLKVDENPRRKGTHGHKSFALIKNGMAIEDFIAAGGRMADLRWDLLHKNVEVK